MKFSTSLVTSLALALTASASAVPNFNKSPSSCNSADRVPVSTRTVTAGGIDFQITTKACPNAKSEAALLTARSLEKRQYNSCASGETQTYHCVTGGTAPVQSDCQSLQTALQSYIADTSNPTLFTVPAGYVEEFSYGTCLYAWINENPTSPPSAAVYLQYCYSGVYIMASNLLSNGCIVNGQTGGYVLASNPVLVPASLNWVFEILHV